MPTAIGRFSDLVCQPFRGVRDATESFLDRLDFLRGDRVAFVTFDRRATLIDPDGAGPQSPMIETQQNINSADPLLRRRGALETLRDVVGVRAETTFYRDTNQDGLWDRFLTSEGPQTWSYFENTAIGNLRTHPVWSACPFDIAVLPEPYVLPTTKSREGGGTYNGTLLQEILPPLWSLNTANGAQYNPAFTQNQLRTYEFRGSCAGTNIGDALQQSSSALFRNGRREGAVWIMVLLSDGAAGASNPVLRNATVPTRADPYRDSNGNGIYEPLAGSPATDPYGYGSFGLCPLGVYSRTTPPPVNQRGELLLDGEFPYCSDKAPESRHFCALNINPSDINRFLDNYPDCVEFYDVDDYARDWADFVGLANVDRGTGSGFGEQLLPTMFTIGFALNYDYINYETGAVVCADTDWNCRRNANIEDTLGEELLRYIGDVGDNFRIDDDYQQVLMGDRIPNRVNQVNPDDREWGLRGPCETPLTAATVRGVYSPLPPTNSCGNYFSARTVTALQDVFNQIAARMFTRLSR